MLAISLKLRSKVWKLRKLFRKDQVGEIIYDKNVELNTCMALDRNFSPLRSAMAPRSMNRRWKETGILTFWFLRFQRWETQFFSLPISLTSTQMATYLVGLLWRHIRWTCSMMTEMKGLDLDFGSPSGSTLGERSWNTGFSFINLLFSFFFSFFIFLMPCQIFQMPVFYPVFQPVRVAPLIER